MKFPSCFGKTITVMCLRESQASEGGDPFYRTPTSHCFGVCFSRQSRVFNTTLVLTKSSLGINKAKTLRQLAAPLQGASCFCCVCSRRRGVQRGSCIAFHSPRTHCDFQSPPIGPLGPLGSSSSQHRRTLELVL